MPRTVGLPKTFSSQPERDVEMEAITEDTVQETMKERIEGLADVFPDGMRSVIVYTGRNSYLVTAALAEKAKTIGWRGVLAVTTGALVPTITGECFAMIAEQMKSEQNAMMGSMM